MLTQQQKYINFLPTIAFSANLQASWEAIVSSFAAGLLNGGPVSTALALTSRPLELTAAADFPRLWHTSLLVW